MSTMKDLWGDKIEFPKGYSKDTAVVVFHGSSEDYGEDGALSMEFDQKKARQFINKLLKAFEEDA